MPEELMNAVRRPRANGALPNPQVVLLMAGLGSRFRAGGYRQSKPMIPVSGVPMFEQALSSLAALRAFDLIAVVRSDQIADEAIDDAVARVRPDARFVVLPAPTRGAAESAVAAAPSLDLERPLIVLDCDLRFTSRRYTELVDDMCSRSSSADLGLLTFRAEDPRYSYARTDHRGRVIEVAEKRVISDSAIAGAYLFARAESFIGSARRVVAGGLDAKLPEYYMSAVVQAMLREGAIAVATPVDEYESFGTPEELDHSMEVRLAR